jgi:uncharacterized membrane protein (DUF106 family)
MLEGELTLLQVLLDLPQEIPYSTIFMLALAAVISLLTTLVNRLLSNPEKTKIWRKEASDWNKELREAQRTKDKKTVDRLMKKQKYIMSLQSKMMWQSMKVSLLFIVPLFLMWSFLGGLYTSPQGPIPLAYLPGIGSTLPLPIFNYSLIWWYLLCSMLFGTVFSHAFKLTEVSE